MPHRTPSLLNIHLLRTLIINIITLVVALALRQNRLRNVDIAPRAWPQGVEAPYVQVIIPARDEASNMPALLRSLLAQQSPPGRWGLMVVDDGSEDSTSEVARRTASTFANGI